MPAMAWTPPFGRSSRPWGSVMWSASPDGQRVARWADPAATKAVGGPRPQAEAAAPRCRAPTAKRPRAGDAIAAPAFPHHHLARRHQCRLVLALCRAAGALRAPRPL